MEPEAERAGGERVAVAAHVAGRGARHPWPAGELEVPVAVNSLAGPFLGRWVEPFYLTDPARLDAAQEAAWCAAARASDDAVLEALLTEADWRPRVVAAWLVALRGADAFEPRLGRLLLRSDVCFAGRAYAVALASLATPQAADWIARYLQHYLALPQLDYDQAEALAALQQLDAARAATFELAWDAYLGGRRDPLPAVVAQVRAQLDTLARLRERVAQPAPPAPPSAPAPCLERRSRSLAARVQRWLERWGRGPRRG
jgi:hypothetical protein